MIDERERCRRLAFVGAMYLRAAAGRAADNGIETSSDLEQIADAADRVVFGPTKTIDVKWLREGDIIEEGNDTRGRVRLIRSWYDGRYEAHIGWDGPIIRRWSGKGKLGCVTIIDRDRIDS